MGWFGKSALKITGKKNIQIMSLIIKALVFWCALVFIGHTSTKESYQKRLNDYRNYFEKSDVDYLIQGSLIPEDLGSKKKYMIQLRKVINMVSILTNLDFDEHKRTKVIDSIGKKAPHPDFLPLLRFIISSKYEDHMIRKKAMYALSRIPHDNMIENILKYLYIKELHFTARLIFIRLTNISLSFIDRDKDFEVVAQQIIGFWRENKEDLEIPVYNRKKMLRMY